MLFLLLFQCTKNQNQNKKYKNQCHTPYKLIHPIKMNHRSNSYWEWWIMSLVWCTCCIKKNVESHFLNQVAISILLTTRHLNLTPWLGTWLLSFSQLCLSHTHVELYTSYTYWLTWKCSVLVSCHALQKFDFLVFMKVVCTTFLLLLLGFCWCHQGEDIVIVYKSAIHVVYHHVPIQRLQQHFVPFIFSILWH